MFDAQLPGKLQLAVLLCLIFGILSSGISAEGQSYVIIYYYEPD
jgi:hypothetical protein